MTKEKALRKEINEILIRSTAWGPMMVQRVRVALQQAHEIIKDLDAQVCAYKTMRNHAQVARNIEILKRFDDGEKQVNLADEYGLTPQRINRIILMTRKHFESQDGTSQVKRVSRKRNRRVKKKTGGGTQAYHPASPDGRGQDGDSGVNHSIRSWQEKENDLHGSGAIPHHAND